MPEPLLDRDTRITYGSLVIGGPAVGTSYHPFGKFSLDLTYPLGRFVLNVLVTGETDLEFATREAALIAAFHVPNARLQIEVNAETRYDFNPATNSGFNMQPRAVLVDDETQTARSAVYEVSVEFGLPADETVVAGLAGLREASVSVSVPLGQGGKRLMDISGTYTAVLGPVAGRAQYLAQIDAYEALVFALVGGSWKRNATPQELHDKENKGLVFRRSYEEEIVGTFIAILPQARFTNQVLDIAVEVSTLSPESGHEDAEKPRDAFLAFSCSVDSAVTTDLAAEWANTIRPHLITQLGASLGSFVVTLDRPVFSAGTNRISATIQARSYAGVSLSELQIVVTDDRDKGFELRPLTDGVPFSYRKYDGPVTWTRTIIRRGIRTIGAGGRVRVSPLFRLAGGDDGQSPLTDIPVPDGFILRREGRDGFAFREGIPGSTEELEAFSETVFLQRADVV